MPVGSKFTDPYDRFVFIIQKNDTLTKLIERINDRRQQIELPVIRQDSLTHLVTSCIYDTTPDEIKSKYFTRKRALPSVTNLVNLASTISHQMMAGNVVHVKKRRDRAVNHCLSNCGFHNTSSSWSAVVTKMVDWVTDKLTLQEVNSFPEEKELGTCSACGGCILKDKTKYSVDSILVGTTPEHIDGMLRVWGKDAFNRCWILKESLQTTETKSTLTRKLSLVHNGSELLRDYLLDLRSKGNGKK